MIRTSRILTASIFSIVIAGCRIYDCGNDIYQRLDNRYGQYKILKFSRSCGATTGSSTQISILPTSEELSNDESGNVFVCNAYINDTSVNVQWTNANAVLIIYGKNLEIYKKDSAINNVKVTYRID